MPEDMMTKLINIVKFKEEKIKIEYVNVYKLC